MVYLHLLIGLTSSKKYWRLAKILAHAVPNLDLFCGRQWNEASFLENYVKLNFDAKHSEKGLNRGRG